jgi:steroid delta-isomerase-like uncharacterized protein
MEELTKMNIIKQYYNCLNDGNIEDLSSLIIEEVKITSSEIDPSRGSGGKKVLLSLIKKYKTAFPDLKFEIKEMFFKESMAVANIAIKGTNSGELFGFIGNNKTIETAGFEMFKFKDEKIVEISRVYDTYKLIKELHLLEEDIIKVL